MIIKKDLAAIIDSSNNIPWNKIEGKTILISGASGMISSYIIETILYLNDKLFKKKSTVLALGRSQKKMEERFKNYLGRDDIKFIIQDVSESVKYNGNIDFIVHAASQADPKHYGVDPVGTLNANSLGTNNLLKLAYEKKVEAFLFVSSGEVYGMTAADPIKENDYGYLDPLQLRSCYAESKRLGETMCVSWHSQFGVPAKIVRPFHTYGPSMSLDDSRVFANFVANIVKEENIVLTSDGSAKRTFCYITDAIVGIFLILFKGKEVEAYNLGNQYQEISMLELAQKLIALFPEKKMSLFYNNEPQNGYLKSPVHKTCPDIGKIVNLGWQPKVTIEEGFKRTVEHFANQFVLKK